MTIATYAESNYVGDDFQTIFLVGFDYLSKADIEVWVNGGHKDTPTHYSVIEGASPSVLFVSPPGAGLSVRIFRNDIPYTQPTDYQGDGPVYPERHERSMDRLLVQLQQLDRRMAALEPHYLARLGGGNLLLLNGGRITL